MIFRFSSGLFHIAAGFTGKYAPYQAIQVAPHPSGGVVVCSTDRGAAAFVGYDRDGRADGTVCFLPNADLVKVSNPIKSAERTLTINTVTGNAEVATHQKSADKIVEGRAPAVSNQDFPPLLEVLGTCVQAWDRPDSSPRAGRYEAKLLRQAIDAATSYGDSVVFSAFDGGPLRVEVEGSSVCFLVMPQTAVPLPGVPDWIRALGAASPVMAAAA